MLGHVVTVFVGVFELVIVVNFVILLGWEVCSFLLIVFGFIVMFKK